ncbi:uncharacterized protein LOC129746573 [Uranotaenia lowii]|uniref:uncharacterized protein LOC129746573 n=1 Tax=Uranotaenia lowii TaxID=190385 RepID=UPI00247ABC43|nr:uncharacterized protein LOC129746573 [Uranotaenia lowii]
MAVLKFCLVFIFIEVVRCDIFSNSITRALVPPRRDIFVSSTQVPEVIINRQSFSTTPQPQSDSQGYFYEPPNNAYLPPENSYPDDSLPPPQLPPFADEYPSIDNAYLPPNNNPPQQDIPDYSEPPVNDYLPPPQQPPQRDEILVVTTEPGYQYDPPSSPAPPFADEGFQNPVTIDNGGYRYDPPSNTYLPSVGRSLRDEVPSIGRSLRDELPNGARTPIRLQLNDLTCLQNNGGFFRSTLTLQSPIEGTPLVDIANDNDLARCSVRVQQSRLLIDINSGDFSRCGVQQCGTNSREMCLRLRFPQITGMRTAADPILTLQCRIQQRVVARTHAVRLGVSNDAQARSSSSTFAFGGSQRPFRSQLVLLRRQDNGGAFTRTLEPGGAVTLGEEMVLRTQVRNGDGWNFTRLSDVIMQRLSTTGSVLNSANLITTAGCLNPTMRAIVPLAPVLESPLSYRLAFRAAMFQGMRSGDEMVLRVRIIGCVDRRECLVENCSNVRAKREAPSDNSSSSTTPATEHELPSEVATISFRIMLPTNATIDLSPQSEPLSLLTFSIVIGSLILVLVLIVLLILLKLHRNKQLTYDEYRSD